MVLKGHLIQKGVRFLWWVIDGSPSTVTVSHPALGTRSRAVEGDLKTHARGLADEMLAAAPHASSSRSAGEST